MQDYLRKLNDAAYAAARAAIKASDPRAEALAALARQTDDLFEAQPRQMEAPQ